MSPLKSFQGRVAESFKAELVDDLHLERKGQGFDPVLHAIVFVIEIAYDMVLDVLEDRH